MSKKWIIVTNASTARIYALNGTRHLDLLHQLNHPDSRKKDSELMSGSLGRYKVRSGAGGGNYSSKTDPKEGEAEHFAQEIAHLLEHGRTTNDFESVILVAPPHFEGLLNKHCSTHVRDKISRVIHKDYHDMNEADLLTLVSEKI